MLDLKDLRMLIVNLNLQANSIKARIEALNKQLDGVQTYAEEKRRDLLEQTQNPKRR